MNSFIHHWSEWQTQQRKRVESATISGEKQIIKSSHVAEGGSVPCHSRQQVFPLISYPWKTPRYIFPWLFFDWWLGVVSGPVIRWNMKWIQRFINANIDTSYRERNRCSQVVDDLSLSTSWHMCKDNKILCSHKHRSGRKGFHKPVSKSCEAGTWLSPFPAVKANKLRDASCTAELRPERGLTFGGVEHGPRLCCLSAGVYVCRTGGLLGRFTENHWRELLMPEEGEHFHGKKLKSASWKQLSAETVLVKKTTYLAKIALTVSWTQGAGGSSQTRLPPFSVALPRRKERSSG